MRRAGRCARQRRAACAQGPQANGIPVSDAAKAAVYEARANLGVDSESEDGEEGS